MGAGSLVAVVEHRCFRGVHATRRLGRDRRDGTGADRALPYTLKLCAWFIPLPPAPFMHAALPCHSCRFDQPGSFVGGGYAGAVAPAGRRMPGVMLAEDAAFQPWQETPWSGRATQGLDAQGQDW